MSSQQFSLNNKRQMNVFVDIQPQEESENRELPKQKPELKKQTQIEESSKKNVSVASKATRKEASYHWTCTEQKRYINFLIENRPMFSLTINQKRNKKIHVKMSNYISMRNSAQCRSHHQKMVSKLGSIDAIIEEFSSLIYPRNIPIYRCFQEPKIEEKTVEKIEEKLAVEAEEPLGTELSFLQEAFFRYEDDEDSIFKILEQKWWQASSDLLEFSMSF